MLTVTPDMRDALDEMAETTGIRPYRLAVCLIDDYVTAHPITAEPTKSPSNKRTHPTPRVFHLPADLHRSLASAAQELGVGALGPQIDVDTAGGCHAQQGADPAENGAFSGHPRDLDR